MTNRYKAEYIGSARDGWEHTELFYKYRGHEYCVTKHNNGYMDKGLKAQHEEEQARIDELIAHENDPKPSYNDENEKAFERILKYFDGEIEECEI